MKKVLIIRFSSIGDIVLTSPVIRCIKKQLPGVELHYLTKKQYLPVVQANPYIDKVHLISKNIREVLPELRKQNFNFIADLHENFRSFGVRLALLRPSAGFPKINFQKWVMVKFKTNLLPEEHIVDRYFKAVDGLGVINDHQGLDYFIPHGESGFPPSIPASHRQHYIAFAIGAKHTTKCMPAEKIISLCRSIPMPVVLLGGPEDREKGAYIAEHGGDHVFNACGILNLNQSAFMVKESDVVITHDTGLMHIAAAFRKRIISVWGNTIPAFGMYPYMPGFEDRSVITEVKGLDCRPCSKLGYDRCPKGHFKCMNDIREEGIAGGL